jgi:hypothetical protein
MSGWTSKSPCPERQSSACVRLGVAAELRITCSRCCRCSTWSGKETLLFLADDESRRRYRKAAGGTPLEC